jgi:hypothetical protein
VEEIVEDLRKYVERFNYDLIPHITENNEINDIIHNYRNTVQATLKKEQKKNSLIDKVLPPNEILKKNPKLNLEQKKPSVKHEDIEDIKKDLKEEKFARMIGLISHLVYWNVFGDRLNALPLDTYHKKLLFI